jgi:predicted membrane channel-forming protein YqfA (hemolysin III family)
MERRSRTKGRDNLSIMPRAARWWRAALSVTGTWLLLWPWLLGFATTNGTLAGNTALGGVVLIGLAVFDIVRAPRAAGGKSAPVGLVGSLWLCVAAVPYGHNIVVAFWSTAIAGMFTAILDLVFLIYMRRPVDA